MADESGVKRTRASGEVLDYLLREFDQNQNPTPEMRKDMSERTGMTEKAVRIWFQNRRAKVRKFERMGKPVKQSSSPGGRAYGSGPSLRSNLSTNISAMRIPIELNDKYCFIECLSLSVGTWQRIILGQHDQQALQQQLVNLSPFTLNTVMRNVDLMVILSRKNLEINYFFLAVSNNSKILFRIFYPILLVLLCLLLDNNISKEDNELRLNLARTPKFSVYFFNGVNANLNQWSICDDFSEGQQVSSAYYAPGGSSTPHVLVGVKSALQFLNSFILENNHMPPYAPHDHDYQEKPYLDNSTFLLKHEWDEPNDYRVLNVAPFDSNSSVARKPYNGKDKKEYDEMFAGAHDFFGVQQDEASPARSPRPMNFEMGAQPYGFEMAQETQEYTGELITSPSALASAATPATALASHVDNYIDYGGNY